MAMFQKAAAPLPPVLLLALGIARCCWFQHNWPAFSLVFEQNTA
jgi:hypothetical protein